MVLLPFVVFSLLLLVFRQSLLRTAVITFLLTFLTTILYWHLPLTGVGTSLNKGFFVAWDILIIIIGAIFFLEILDKLHIVSNLCYKLEMVSADYRIQVILLAWFLENFIEGTAGFGTPCAIAAPLLVALGLSPITAVIVSLLGNSTSVAFGAAGTPIRVGLAGLDITNVPFYTAAFSFVGALVPVFILWTATRGKKGHFIEALPFAILSGLAFVFPSFFIVELGQEFPSILGSVIGLFIMILILKVGLFVPKNIRQLQKKAILQMNLSLFKTALPYALLILFLIIGKPILKGYFNPGWAFIFASLPVIIFYNHKTLGLSSITKTAILRTIEPFLVILAMSSTVQLMINSGNIATLASYLNNNLLPLIVPFVGAFGAFLTGSATVSNIMFGALLNNSSLTMGFVSAQILALGTVGAAAGNMVALADMLSAQAIVKLKNQELAVIKGVIIPCLIYIFLVGLIGLAFVK